ncbi:MAG: hypothetical protein IT317_19260 [Anaerolineales bacterium]|nr:hypothetical protein [Anaerolineales bacterium]
MNLSIRARLLAVATVLSLAGLACGSGLGVGAPTAPASPIPISTEAAGEFENLWENALKNAGPNGEVTVVMTEEQVTSFVALKLAEEADNPLTNIQIYLRDGKMTLTGDAKLGAISAPATIAISVTVDATGDLVAEIEDADFGPVPVPQSVLDQLNESIAQSITNELSFDETQVTIQSIAIADGKMSFSGIVNQ